MFATCDDDHPRRARRGTLAALALAAGLLAPVHAEDWPAYRHDARRSGAQPDASALADPARVATLHVSAAYPPLGQPPLGAAFAAAPIVVEHRVLVGNSDGYFRAFDARTLSLIWQYPQSNEQPLVGDLDFLTRGVNPSGIGIAGGATVAHVGHRRAVIFGAPDRCPDVRYRLPRDCTGTGNGYLFALDIRSGALLWRSDPVAVVEGAAYGQRHPQIGYSAPLVHRGHVYVGLADQVDDPVQIGLVRAVELATGKLDRHFSFQATTCAKHTGCGGGVWSSVAADGRSLFFATGNSVADAQGVGPAPDFGQALVRVDPATGRLAPGWPFQAHPFPTSDDDFAATPSVAHASCGELVLGTQKDGATHAVPVVAAGGGRVTPRWSFPPNSLDNNGNGYASAGAVWGDVYFVTDGDRDLATDPNAGFKRLTALNICAPERERVRWMLEYPRFAPCDPGADESCGFGPPTVSNGIVYVGTRTGHLLVIEDPAIDAQKIAGWRCDDPQLTAAQCRSICTRIGCRGAGRLVPIPHFLDIDLGLGDLAVAAPQAIGLLLSDIVGEPVLADGRVYIAAGSHAVHPGVTSLPGCATPLPSDPLNCTKGRLLMLEP